VFAALLTSAAHAGQLGGDVAWVMDATPLADLALNNDDYIGAFADNPNHFATNDLSSEDLQSIVSIERIIPTQSSGGVTEYAVTIGGGYSDSDAPGVTLDSKFMLQLGFGTGNDFVPANALAPGLVFDDASNVSPEIGNFFFFDPSDDTPILSRSKRR